MNILVLIFQYKCLLYKLTMLIYVPLIIFITTNQRLLFNPIASSIGLNKAINYKHTRVKIKSSQKNQIHVV